MAIKFLSTNADRPIATVVLAHGAGAPMRTPYMDTLSAALAANRLSVARFEFAYMAARHQGQRKPPPRADRLTDEYLAAVKALKTAHPLVIAGKSMGGRVASMIADQLFDQGRIKGLACFGYPFHPPGQPDKLRTAHLENMRCPALICQGTRDPFGTREEVAGFALSGTISFCWLEDGEHDLRPRKASGHTQKAHIEAAAARLAGWIKGLNRR